MMPWEEFRALLRATDFASKWRLVWYFLGGAIALKRDFRDPIGTVRKAVTKFETEEKKRAAQRKN